ncbi:rliB, partial [Symbiodinium sp. CCMP2456]
SSNPLNTKGLVVGDGGLLEVYGLRYWPTWTRLASTAMPGATELSLQDQVDWKVGQEVAVITTAWTDEPDNHQNEVREIASVSGTQITLTEGLEFGHYGGPEYSAEVALLSRTITFQGDEASESTRYGGHVMCLPGSQCHLAGAAAIRMGQENVMGRYPFHLHMMGQVNGDSFFEDCLVRRSYFRAYTVHGTSNSRVSRNVAYDVSGSAYYLEDGVEEDNLFDYNLAAFVHIIDRLNDYEAGGGQEGVRVQTQASRIVPTDATAVGFYCTNAKNRWIGNSASGGFSGFHFPRVEYALGDSYASNQ